MTTIDDVRRICNNLPGVTEGTDEHFAMCVAAKDKVKGFLWTWMERVDPKKARMPNDRVLAVMVPNLTAKDALIASDPEKFFTEPHYNGFPAVLVRLDAVQPSELEDLVLEAWKCKTPKDLIAENLAEG